MQLACGKKAKERQLPMQPGDVPITYADISLISEKFDFKSAIQFKKALVNLLNGTLIRYIIMTYPPVAVFAYNRKRTK